ncbi:MAG: HAMP domain-containing histidine kinase [Erysipelotrichaceae bacterium]|nr:HAMP domain-containing histidine kinase [Erysipelotrichaceae bacterium]
MKPKYTLYKSLFGKMMLYLLCMVAVLIITLWVFQIGMLEITYKDIRTRQIKKVTSNIAQQLDGNDTITALTPENYENDMAILVVSLDDRIYTVSNQNTLGIILGRNPENKILEIIDLYKTTKSDVFYISNQPNRHIFDGNTADFTNKNSDNVSGIAYLTGINDDTGKELLVIGLCEIVPVYSTINTLRTQLTSITIIIILIAVIVAYIIARRISRPIENLTSNAKVMSTGDFDVEFHGTGFNEIEELSDTLNFTAQELKKSDQLTKDLIANVSHDLRTPLTMISGYGELIRDVPGESTPENIQVIIDEANRLTTLVNYMLDVSKLQSGTTEIQKGTVNANDLLSRVGNTYITMMEKMGYHFTVDCDEEIKYVQGDASRIEQVLHNLINNAINHIGEDKTVILKCHEHNDKMKFEVIDHGTGIKEEDIPLIWQRYYKANNISETGSGLGLSIVKTILELHDAEYGVESKINEGSDFWFELPLVKDGI